MLLKDFVEIDTAETSDFPRIDHVPDDLLSECIAQTDREDIEVAARLEYWRYLNHAYRDRYRMHRDAEDAATKAGWELANPDLRTWWDKFCGRKAPSYSRPPGSPFTYPSFEATVEQRQNMQRLSEILREWISTSRPGYTMGLAELYREMGRFDDAERVMQNLDERDVGVTSNLLSKLIKEKQTAPMRYMM